MHSPSPKSPRYTTYSVLFKPTVWHRTVTCITHSFSQCGPAIAAGSWPVGSLSPREDERIVIFPNQYTTDLVLYRCGNLALFVKELSQRGTLRNLKPPHPFRGGLRPAPRTCAISCQSNGRKNQGNKRWPRASAIRIFSTLRALGRQSDRTPYPRHQSALAPYPRGGQGLCGWPASPASPSLSESASEILVKLQGAL